MFFRKNGKSFREIEFNFATVISSINVIYICTVHNIRILLDVPISSTTGMDT